MRKLISLVSMLLPWSWRRSVLQRLLGYDLHPTSRIGFAWICPQRLTMGPGSRIEALSVCRGVELLALAEGAVIGPANWITGMPREGALHYRDEPQRSSDLIVGPYAILGSRHYIDCSNRVSIGAYSRLDGVRTVVLSHSVDITVNRQRSRPVAIGAHCLIGTSCVILPGTRIADFCVVEAASLVRGTLDLPHTLYAGSPARPVAPLAPGSAYGARGSTPGD